MATLSNDATGYWTVPITSSNTTDSVTYTTGVPGTAIPWNGNANPYIVNPPPLNGWTTTADEFTPEDKLILHEIIAKIKARNNPPSGHPADPLDVAIDQAVKELMNG